jgi:hypothetical protein
MQCPMENREWSVRRGLEASHLVEDWDADQHLLGGPKEIQIHLHQRLKIFSAAVSQYRKLVKWLPPWRSRYHLSQTMWDFGPLFGNGVGFSRVLLLPLPVLIPRMTLHSLNSYSVNKLKKISLTEIEGGTSQIRCPFDIHIVSQAYDAGIRKDFIR